MPIMTREYNIKIVYKDKNFLVIMKPAGLLMHASPHILKGNKYEKTLADWLLENYPETGKVGDEPKIKPGMVHRLDRDTSGVVVIARNQEFFDHLKNLFKKGEIKKTYSGLVEGKLPKKGKIDKPIGLIHGSTRRSIRGRKMKMVKEAVTEYKSIKYIEKDDRHFTLVEIYPKTGRTHQIRVHMASLGHPIIGDKMYGKAENPWGLKRQFLHAKSLEFSLLDGKRIKIEADLPNDLRLALKMAEGKAIQ